jgi:hypothetical protein
MTRSLTVMIKEAVNKPPSYRKLERRLCEIVPFFASHDLRVRSVDVNRVEIWLPYHRSNLNHLGGMYAGAHFMVAEAASGLLLLSRVDSDGFKVAVTKCKGEWPSASKGLILARCEYDTAWLTRLQKRAERSQANGLGFRVSMNARVFDSRNTLVSSWKFEWYVRAQKK